jgi:predicted Rossmann-fold nucleotide-binding protein
MVTGMAAIAQAITSHDSHVHGVLERLPEPMKAEPELLVHVKSFPR